MSRVSFVHLFIIFLTLLTYVESHYGYRTFKTCQYFKHGRLYRGPCNGYAVKKPIYGIENIEVSHALQGSFCKTTDGLEGTCKPPTFCFNQFDSIEQYIENKCVINGLTGICCANVQREISIDYELPIKIPIPIEPEVPLELEEHQIQRAAEYSRKIVRKQLALERELIRKGFFQEHNSMEAFHQAFFGPHDEQNRKLARDGLIALETTLQLAKEHGLTKSQAGCGLQKYTLYSTSLSKHCPKIPYCKKHAKYRTIDASCNNLDHPLWAKSLTQFSRLIPPAYADGVNELRRASDNSRLPTARQVSLLAAVDFDIPDKKFALFVMQWGQIIDHDLTLSASTRADSGEGLHCCHEGLQRQSQIQHPACKPIRLSQNDPFYQKFGHRCNNFVRNAPSPKYGCNLGYREQTNQLTHVIDGSMVYGSTDERAQHLRSFQDGKLRISKVNNVEFLPFDTQNKSDECAIPARSRLQCFVGGDVRVNEQTGLTMLHNLLLREHNRVASVLQDLNPGWTDEIIYQEARRIVAAEIQHITYNEWMPLILGRKVMKSFNLLLQPHDYSYDYDPYLNPSILNEFATAAYRFHSLIQGFINLMNNHGKVTTRLQLRNLFNNPTSIYPPGAYDEFLNGYSSHPAQTFDQFFSEELTNHLFEEEGTGFGMDLIALNIQRGRDHGLPDYNSYREVCGLPRIRSFDELNNIMRRGSAQVMANLYKSVDDIDLFIGGNHEKPLPGAVVGPVLACILAEQARRNKIGDRFWYENGKMRHSFNKDQLNQIRKSNLARLICDNSDSIEYMQPLAYLQPAEWNQRIPCNKIAGMNLEYWKNEPVSVI